MNQKPQTLSYFPISDSLQKQDNAYISVRDKEDRLLPDEVVTQLPDVPHNHPRYKEWQYRKASLKILLKFLEKNHPKASILDIGCGNGWMSHALAARGFTVTGLDINRLELEQAHRVFKQPNLYFVQGDIMTELPIGPFDFIVLSAAFQYFEDGTTTLQYLKRYLSGKGGTIIMDTFFYKDEELGDAARRSQQYFEGLNADAMAQYYFHHPVSVCKKFPHKTIYKPSFIKRVSSKLGGHFTPFPIYLITY